MYRAYPVRRVFSLQAAVLATCFLVACAPEPRFGDAPFFADDQTLSYRNLADIPEKPLVTSTEDNQQVILSLSQQRASTEAAAEALARDPFTVPEPLPPDFGP